MAAKDTAFLTETKGENLLLWSHVLIQDLHVYNAVVISAQPGLEEDCSFHTDHDYTCTKYADPCLCTGQTTRPKMLRARSSYVKKISLLFRSLEEEKWLSQKNKQSATFALLLVNQTFFTFTFVEFKPGKKACRGNRALSLSFSKALSLSLSGC